MTDVEAQFVGLGVGLERPEVARKFREEDAKRQSHIGRRVDGSVPDVAGIQRQTSKRALDGLKTIRGSLVFEISYGEYPVGVLLRNA